MGRIDCSEAMDGQERPVCAQSLSPRLATAELVKPGRAICGRRWIRGAVAGFRV